MQSRKDASMVDDDLGGFVHQSIEGRLKSSIRMISAYTKLGNDVKHRIICKWWVGGRSIHKQAVDIKHS